MLAITNVVYRINNKRYTQDRVRSMASWLRNLTPVDATLVHAWEADADRRSWRIDSEPGKSLWKVSGEHKWNNKQYL